MDAFSSIDRLDLHNLTVFLMSRLGSYYGTACITVIIRHLSYTSVNTGLPFGQISENKPCTGNTMLPTSTPIPGETILKYTKHF